MRTRNWSIRSKIVALLAVPLSTLVVLWLLLTASGAGLAGNLYTAKSNADRIGKPSSAFVGELQAERRDSIVYLASNRTDPAALTAQRAKTDTSLTTVRRLMQGENSGLDADATLRLREMFTQLDRIPTVRQAVDQGEVDRSAAMRQYTEIIDSLYRLYVAASTVDEPNLSRQLRSVSWLHRATELLSEEDALVSGATTAGRFAPGEYQQIVGVIGAQRQLYLDSVGQLPLAQRTRYDELMRGDAVVALRRTEDRIVAEGRAGSAVPVDAATWRTTYGQGYEAVRGYELAVSDDLLGTAGRSAMGLLLRLGLTTLISLVAVLLSIIVSVRIGRSLINRINRLRISALDLAAHQLPAVVARLRQGEDVDTEAETPPLAVGTDEIAQLAQAFSQVQCTAVRSAVDEATLRRGMNEVFLNMARRSQALLHRQLSLLDQMERRATDPEELENLFRLDHMATRMRRHAEDLVILAGAAPGRGWRQPVPLIDVIRGAVSEIEEYSRVDVMAVPDNPVIGRSVGDLIHLLAELIENATSFSPPQTRVQIGAQTVPNGVVIEIEDRGLGVCPHVLVDTNRWLSDPPEFDPANSARLGLFIVAKLAARNHVDVTLRRSPYGGLTAIVLLPPDLVVGHPGAVHGRDRLDGVPAPGIAERAAQNGAPAAPPAQLQPAANDAPAGAVLTARRPNPPAHLPAGANGTAGAPDAAEQPFTATLASGRGQIAGPPAPLRAVNTTAGTGGNGSSGSSRNGSPGVRTDGLPKRVRQANLAPKLRAVEEGPVEPDATAPVRSPEQIRSMMSSFQAGTTRGRQEASPDADESTSDPWPTTPETGGAGPLAAGNGESERGA